MTSPSHGHRLPGILYLAAGTAPHPAAILLHGFPGYEHNLDIAKFLRARSWNVLAVHYRGSWGAKGDFSFEHAAQDSDSRVRFVLNPANAREYAIRTRRAAAPCAYEPEAILEADCAAEHHCSTGNLC